MINKIKNTYIIWRYNMDILNAIRSDLNKTIINIGFLGAVLLTALLCFTAPTYHVLTTDRSYSVFESFFTFKREFMQSDQQFASINVFQNGLGGYITMFLPIIVAFPFMVSFCAERNSGLMRFTISRTGCLRYYLSKFLSVLIGRNGSGKTMLMKCICGFVKPTSGEITVDGKRVGKDVDFPDDMGIIIETPGFIPYYSGYKNLKLLAGLKNKIGKEQVRDSMKQVGLDPELRRHVRKYSLGMRQRLGLAQAIMENPKILILDEPFNGLDKDGVKEMREYLLSYKEQGKTILICSHSAEDIEVLCETVHEMDKGIIQKIS